jgi:membrane protein DedA with SNARE-associated domain
MSRRLEAATLEGERDALPLGAPAEETAAPVKGIWRLEFILLGLFGLLTTGTAVIFFAVGFDLERLSSYGYVGLFLVSLISAASIIMPMPGVAAITGAGALLDPVLGIPVPILVGVVAGVAESLGEFTGYVAGYGGSAVLRDHKSYPRVKGWMLRNGALTMFLLSSFPNPMVDVAGVAAGAVQLPVRKFFFPMLAGKFIKNVYLASGGLAAGQVIERMF